MKEFSTRYHLVVRNKNFDGWCPTEPFDKEQLTERTKTLKEDDSVLEYKIIEVLYRQKTVGGWKR